jgi:hypothetical protein
MSHVFLQTMKANPRQSYIEACNHLLFHVVILTFLEKVLQNTRATLAQKYQQIPQLSVGGLYNLNQPVNVSNENLDSKLKI